MLTRAENQMLTQVGPGTPMGELLRECWTPALRSAGLEADGAPARVRLLGENFVAFRSTDGRVGFFDEGCPHRCTSLALARNEDNALTCIFHGWKIDVSGKVVEVPSEPPERRTEFAAKVRVRHYPVREAGGLVWVYLGKREQPPQFYNFEFHQGPASAIARRAVVHGNWLQGFEGQLDSAHLGMLHSSAIAANPFAIDNRTGPMSRANTAPSFEFILKPYGFREAALRHLPDGTVYARIREVVLPYFSFIPGDQGKSRLVVAVVPIDDEWSAHWYYYMNPYGPVPQDYRDWAFWGTTDNDDNYSQDMGNRDNMWHQDRRAMKEGHWSGIMRNFTYEDFIVEESMGPIVDRSREYLGSSDTVIIRSRRMLLKALREHREHGTLPFGLDRQIDYSRVRALAIRFPATQNWLEIDPLNPPPAL
ncbi:MAG TPA: Rieske 2Fe-2S domain-containing protein [Candidatus Binataceae bacterium]|nr:Rieske 2Fe-2S domain-containing protein [Candidatus Binataceae bacterium]